MFTKIRSLNKRQCITEYREQREQRERCALRPYRTDDDTRSRDKHQRIAEYREQRAIRPTALSHRRRNP